MNALDFNYKLLFSKNKKGEYKHAIIIPQDSMDNILYGKEIFIPETIKSGRDYLFQALGYIGAYGNNYYDETIQYMFLPDKTLDLLMIGVKDEYVLQIEDICTKQKESYKDPKKWKFRMKFIFEKEVVSFIKRRGKYVGSALETEQIEKYERSY